MKNRRPYWYSITKPPVTGERVVLPEHIHKRYVATRLGTTDESVVVDKLFVFQPDHQESAEFVHASMNSLLSWYQYELRGRSQLGEGVLELKIPDYTGVRILNPKECPPEARAELVSRFLALTDPGSGQSLQELGSSERLSFDAYYMELCGFTDPEGAALLVERELRALANERAERKLSVADAKVSKRKATSVAASVDAYAAKIASAVPPFPDPRSLVGENDPTVPVLVSQPPEGAMEIGESLFDQGEVRSAGAIVAHAGSFGAAQFVRGALLADPEVEQVLVPQREALERALRDWNLQEADWQTAFDVAFERVTVGIDDPRTRGEIRLRALRLCHAG